MNDFYVVLVGCLVAIPCAILGSWLLLRRLSMVGDAISHAILPGIVIGFLITNSRNTGPMLFWACLFGMLCTVLIEWLQHRVRLQSDAAIGITFTWLFAVGVILVSLFSGQVDLDQDCVLYGELAYVPLDLWVTTSGWNLGPKAAWIMGSVTLLVLLFTVLAYKELKISAFDPAYAQLLGFRTAIWHYTLMAMVSLVTVTAFESVGAILVVALLVVPAATAYILVRDLKLMILLASLFGVVSATFGYALAAKIDGSIAGGITTVAGGLLLVALAASRIKRIYQVRQSSQLATGL